MKIAHLADIHVSDSRAQEFKQVLDQLGESITQSNPDVVVFAGDMFIHRDRLSPKQVELTRQFFKETLGNYQVIIIPGNHDASMSETKIDSLSAIFSNEDKLKVYSTLGEYLDIGDYRFHMFGYPSKKELVKLGVNDVTRLYKNKALLNSFKLDATKQNILVYHGTLEGFNIADKYIASEEAIGVGKDMIMPKTFWSKFDAVMAGHLHKYQGIDKAVYPGCPLPLTFADSDKTGWVLWDDLEPTFVEVKQLYPYRTIDVGDISRYKSELTREAVRRIQNDYDYTDVRVRIRYKIIQPQSGSVNHTVLSSHFRNAKDIKIVPQFLPDVTSGTKAHISFDDFQHHTVKEVILEYIDSHKFSPGVKKVAEKIEDRLKIGNSVEEEKGLHFKPLRLSLSNFKSFGPDTPVLDFEALDKVVGILGPNKSGKSSLVEAVIWALFGSTLRNKIAKTVIRNEQSSCEVTLEFIAHDVTYKITRVRSKTGAAVTLYRKIKDDWVDISGAEGKDTQKAIEKLVGTMGIFIATVYSPQNKIDLLVEKKPTDRKKIILDCLQIDVLDKRSEEIVVLKKEVRDKLQQTRGKAEAYADQLARLIDARPEELLQEFSGLLKNEKTIQDKYLSHVESLSKKIHSYEEMEQENKELNQVLANIREEIQQTKLKKFSKEKERDRMEGIMSDKSVIDRGLQRLTDYKEKLKEQSEELIRNTERKNKIAQFNLEIQKQRQGHAKLLSTMVDSREAITKQIESLKLFDCPKADCPLNETTLSHKDLLRIQLDKARETIEAHTKETEVEINEVKEQIIRVEVLIENSIYDKDKHMEYIRAYKEEELNKWPEMEQSVSSGVNLLENMMELVAAYERQLESLRSRRNAATNRRSELATRIAAIGRYKSELDDTRLDLAECSKKISNYEKQILRCNQNIEDIGTLQKEVKEHNDLTIRLENYHAYCNKYSEIVGKAGVIFSIVDKALPVIERFAQELLSDTTNGTISISIDAFKTLSSGGNKDEVSIYILDSKGKRDVLEASGAETVLVSLALRAAMAHLLSLRMGSMVELFIIDEGMGALDDENIVVIKDMFKRLGEEFNKVLFITHVAELKDVAQSVVEVSSNGLISTFKIAEKNSGKQ